MKGIEVSNSSVPSLPESLREVGTLSIRRTGLTSIPENLKEIRENLNISFLPTFSLPNGLTVGGNLGLLDVGLTSLPENLTVNGDFSMSMVGITSLPENLKINGDFIVDKKFTSIPDSVEIGGNILLDDGKGPYKQMDSLSDLIDNGENERVEYEDIDALIERVSKMNEHEIPSTNLAIDEMENDDLEL